MRYRKLYKIQNHLDEKYFDIILNTTYLNENLTFQKICLDLAMII